MILDGLLFKIIELDDGRLDTVLCIPTSKVHILLDTYHSSLIGGHSGITKCYQTVSQKFYCPNLCYIVEFWFLTANSLNVHSLFYYNYSYCKFIDILFKRLNFLFIEFSLYIGFIVLEIRS